MLTFIAEKHARWRRTRMHARQTQQYQLHVH